MSCWVAALPVMKPRVGNAGQGLDESGTLTHNLLGSNQRSVTRRYSARLLPLRVPKSRSSAQISSTSALSN